MSTRIEQEARNAYGRALAAAHYEADWAEAIEEDRDRQERAWSDRTIEAGRKALERIFPGSEWRVWDTGIGGYGANVILVEAESARLGNPLLKIKVEHLLRDADDPEGPHDTKLSCVRRVQDTSMPGYSYWFGPEVKTAADIGRWLVEQEES